ncbi:hypothetical protein OVA07_09535 [Novosphingobium sp. SL115]|uniref:hypothetical protein n=1 Tax=Novosphingobium sp. SL115 TaxID=2995150 RepID=UPI00227543BA|nr:hypothetical protein [Novosphingobium sp. SL115]MCY1671252.1 hypothetical protein [Novosphingobium sp. SL115]
MRGDVEQKFTVTLQRAVLSDKRQNLPASSLHCHDNGANCESGGGSEKHGAQQSEHGRVSLAFSLVTRFLFDQERSVENFRVAVMFLTERELIRLWS